MEIGCRIWSVRDGCRLGGEEMSKDLALAFNLYAEARRKIIGAQTKESLSRCREEGISLGRPSGSQNKEYKLDKDRSIIQRMLSKGKSKAEISRKIGSSKNTLYRWLRQNDLI